MSVVTIATICAETAENLNRTAMVMGKGIVELLAAKYNFDVAEAFEAISFEVPKKANKKANADKKEKDAAAANGSRKSSKTGPAFPLPFIGIVKAEWCQGIRTNHGLFTQCTQPKPTGDDAHYCPTCSKQADANASGKPTYGNINDRMAALEAGTEWRDPKDNKAVSHYANVATKLKIDLEAAKAECFNVFGIYMPADLLEVKVAQRGRPKKDASAIVSDTDSSASASSSEKKRGRPKKNKAVIEGGAAGDDLIATLVADAQQSTDSDSKPKKTTKVPKAELTEEEKAAKKAEAAEKRKASLAAKKAELSDEEKKAKKAEAAEKRKQAKIAKEEAYVNAEAEAILAAKGLSSAAPSTAGNSSGTESTTPVKTQPQSKPKSKPKSKPQPQPEPEPEPEPELEIEDLEEDEDLEDDEEEQEQEVVGVKVFVHPITNVKYLKTPDNILYDPNTQDEIGIYDPNTHDIQPIADDEDEDDC